MNVILVDDSFSARRALQAILEGTGCTVRSFEDIDGGLSSFEETPADAVFCDLVLKEEDGVAMWRRLQERLGEETVPFALISGLIDDGVRDRAETEGIQWLLAKPFSTEAVEEVLDAMRSVSQPNADAPDEVELHLNPALLELASCLIQDLSGLHDLKEVVIFSDRGDVVAASNEFVSDEVRAWFSDALQFLSSSDFESGRSVVLETGSAVWVALDLIDGARLICSMARFTSVGPIRFFSHRRLAHVQSAPENDERQRQLESSTN